MVKPLKPACHFFFSEADTKGKTVTISEAYYINHVLRDAIREKNFTVNHYGYSHENNFKKVMKSKNQNEDMFFVIFDTDFNNVRELEIVTREIKSISKQYITLGNKHHKNLEIIISSRCFETYMCMYGRDVYTKPYTNMDALIGDIKFNDYKKAKKWFEGNAEVLKSEIDNLSSRIQKSREIVFGDYDCPLSDYNNPDFKDQQTVNFLAGTAPYTYFDILLDKVL